MLQKAPAQPQLFHFLGIGGAGMRALATVMDCEEVSVSGSDCSPAACDELGDRGWAIDPATNGVDLSEVDALICSDAIHADHPVRRDAARLGVAIQSYADLVGKHLIDQAGAAIAGTHGKSTTTAMVAEILIAAGLDPTVFCGAVPISGWSATGGRRGRSDLVVAEACEYRDNFLKLRGSVAAITNIEPDHFDFFKTAPQLQNSFRRFAAGVDRAGVLVVNQNCSSARDASRAAQCRVETFGHGAEADWNAEISDWRDGCAELRLKFRGKVLGTALLKVLGEHNVLNAIAAVAVAMHCGARPNDVVEGLTGYSGLRRRLQRVGEFENVHIWDDYAHHPTEIRAALESLRRVRPASRIVCVFQPHQVSRTEALFDEFADALQLADLVLVAPIFRARERRSKGSEPSADDLASHISRCGTPSFACGDFQCIQSVLKLVCCTGDVLVTLGAGDIWKVSHAVAN